jgi:hypothetical protein
VEEALQWLYKKKLMYLESEANLIREQLLQESLAMRRSLELSSIESNEFASSCRQKCVTQLENFHSALKELSDRLFPPCMNEGLPFALEYLIQKWREQFPWCQFELNLPLNWLQNSLEHNCIALTIVDDLLRIHTTAASSKNLIFINLQQNVINCQPNNQLEVTFTSQNTNKQLPEINQPELKYLQESFEALTLGTCHNTLTKNSNIWRFSW